MSKFKDGDKVKAKKELRNRYGVIAPSTEGKVVLSYPGPGSLVNVQFDNFQMISNENDFELVSSARDLSYVYKIIGRLDEVRRTACNHAWTKYVGLTEIYDFCTVCDEKRKPDGHQV